MQISFLVSYLIICKHKIYQQVLQISRNPEFDKYLPPHDSNFKDIKHKEISHANDVNHTITIAFIVNFITLVTGNWWKQYKYENKIPAHCYKMLQPFIFGHSNPWYYDGVGYTREKIHEYFNGRWVTCRHQSATIPT